MRLANTNDSYGSIARALHWLSALVIIGLFALGLWMRGLGYYDPWYQLGPDWHRSVGVTLFAVILFRMVWRSLNPHPDDSGLSPFERQASRWTHRIMYGLLIALCLSGYLISTLDGRPITVFWLFDLPSLIEAKGMEDTAGLIHEYLAYSLIGLAVLHALAALKHHFIDGDTTLRRMISTS